MKAYLVARVQYNMPPGEIRFEYAKDEPVQGVLGYMFVFTQREDAEVFRSKFTKEYQILEVELA